MAGSDDRPSIPFCGAATTPLRRSVVPPGPQVMQIVSKPAGLEASTRSPDLPFCRSTAWNLPLGSVSSPKPCLPVSASSQPSSRPPAFAVDAVWKTTNKLPTGGTVPGTESNDLPSKRSTLLALPPIIAVVLSGASCGFGGTASPDAAERFGQSVTFPALSATMR